MVSIQYVMARDTELPKGLMKLNIFGVPWKTLVAAVVLPSMILLVTGDLDMLAGLYAIGVVGAIAINLGSCCWNREMPLRAAERVGMGLLAAIMVAIEMTLSVEKPSALLFAGSVLGIGLSMRFVTKTVMPARARKAALTKEREALGLTQASAPEVTEYGTPAGQLDMSKPKILMATRGGMALINFGVKYTKRLDGILMVMFVRQINVIGMGTTPELAIEDDHEALAVFKKAAEACKKAGPEVAYAILDHAATYNVEAVLMGITRETGLLRALRGDVLSAVAGNLPEDISLLIHA